VAGDDENVTLGELSRLIVGLRNDIVRMQETYVTAKVWEVEKRAFEDRHQAMGREIGGLRADIEKMKTEKQAEHKAFDLELDTIRADAAAKTEQARKGRAQTWLAIGLATFAAILSIGGGLLTQALTGGA
jgi:hypothetical protein